MPYYLFLNNVYRIGFLFSHISYMNNRLLRRKFCLPGMANFWDLCAFQDCKGNEGPFLSTCQVPMKSYPLLNFQKGHNVSHTNTLQKSISLLTRPFHMTGNVCKGTIECCMLLRFRFQVALPQFCILFRQLLLGNPHSHKLFLIHCLFTVLFVSEVNMLYISRYLQVSKTC